MPGASRRNAPAFRIITNEIILCVILALTPAVLIAQNQTSQPASQPAASQPVDSGDTLTVDAMTARIKQIESATGMDDAGRAKLLELYKTARAQLQAARTFEAKAAEFEKARLDAPAQLDALKQRLAERTTTQPTTAATSGPASAPASQPVPIDAEATSQPVGDLTGKTLHLLEQQFATAETEKSATAQVFTGFLDEAKARADRLAAIPDLISNLRKQLDATATELDAPVDSPTEVTLAQRTAQLARKRAIEAEIRLYETEARSYEARRELLSVSRDLARIDMRLAIKAFNRVRRAVAAQRKADAEAQQELARRELQTAPAVIRELAERNLKLSEERIRLTEAGGRLSREIQTVIDATSDHKKRYQDIKDQVATIGLTDEIGLLLRREKARLPDVRQYNRRIAARKSEIARTKLAEINLEPEQDSLSDIEVAVKRKLSEIPGADAEPKRADLEHRIREMLTNQRDFNQALGITYQKHSTDLAALNRAEGELAAVVEGITQFIDENVLWIRSTGLIHTARLPEDWVGQIAAGWSTLIKTLSEDVRRDPVTYGLAVVIVLLMILPRRRLNTAFADLADRTTRVYEDRFRLTIWALIITLFLSALWPTIIYFIAWRLDRSMQAGPVGTALSSADFYDFIESIAGALKRISVMVLLLSVARQVCRRRGLASAHFRWRAEGIRILRRNLTWAVPVVVPAGLIIWACEGTPDNAWRDLVGRGAFIIAMIILSVMLWRILRPRGGLLAGYLERHKNGWIDDLKWIWYPVGFGTPIVLAIAACLGYHYTALQIETRMMLTLWLILALVFANGLLVRYLLVAQRRIAIEQIRHKREAEQAKAMEAPASPSDAPPPPIVIDKTVDLAAVHTQTRSLLTGLMLALLVLGSYAIWVDILPAFKFLNRIELWSQTRQVMEIAADGATVERTKVESVTLSNVGVALIVSVIAFVLSRNFPGLLEVTILQKLPLTNAGRYAITTVSRYVLALIGVVVAFGAIGVGWSQVQWLAAAITVGLGFGLQEIFANFVSGLIILFEQPIRPGDIVTVGDQTGMVSKIRIRATTLLDPDRKELIIPNKDFVTGRILNWTLTDAITRLVFPVGVAYGTDPAKVEAVLLDTIKGLPDITEDPAPVVLFIGFGDSSLNFELRIYVKTLDARMRLQHEVNKRIAASFAQARLEIPFPQRDLHIRSVSAEIDLRPPTPPQA